MLKLMVVIYYMFDVVMNVGPGFCSCSASMDWTLVHKIWEKWASNSVGSSGEQAKAIYAIYFLVHFFFVSYMVN